MRDIAVHRVVRANIGRAECAAITQRGDHTNVVFAWEQVGEVIVTSSVRGVGANSNSLCVVEGDDHVDDAWLARLLDAVAVQVLPDVVAERSIRRAVTSIPCRIVFTSDERCYRRATRCWVGIAVSSVVGSHVIGGEQATGVDLRWEANAVIAGLQVVEVIIAFTVGHICAHSGAGGIVKSDCDVSHAWFTCVLQTIAVQILEDAISEGGEW